MNHQFRTVGELKKILQNVPDETDVLIRIYREPNPTAHGEGPGLQTETAELWFRSKKYHTLTITGITK